jgi:class 3 adenylate cyclase
MSQTHRLTAILAADVAGYSRLMEADEESTGLRIHRDRPKGLSRASFELVRQRRSLVFFSNRALLLDEVAVDTPDNQRTPGQ